MAWLLDLLKEVENNVQNKENAFQYIGYRVVIHAVVWLQQVNRRQGNETYRANNHNDTEGLAFDNIVAKIRQQAIFDDIEDIEIEIELVVIDDVVIAVNQLRNDTITAINKNNPQLFSFLPISRQKEESYGYHVG